MFFRVAGVIALRLTIQEKNTFRSFFAGGSTILSMAYAFFLKLSKTNKGEIYLLVLVDSYSKSVEAFVLITQEANKVAKALFVEVFYRFGAARILNSNCGKIFMNDRVLS